VKRGENVRGSGRGARPDAVIGRPGSTSTA
jgi:hypothetical protein